MRKNRPVFSTPRLITGKGVEGMKGMKVLALTLVAGAVALFAGGAFAFHDGGVAHCNGCHTMHNSQDGALVDGDSPNGNPWLLIDATPSDVCLSCHATRLGAVFAVDVKNPAREIGGGNFIFLLEDNLNDGHGGGDLNDPNDPNSGWADAIPGDAAGHNLNAPGYGLSADVTLSTAPGGTFPGANLGCSSCHDPHGSDTFRLLYGAGRLVQDFYTFTNEAPDAVGTSIFGGPPESNSYHTAYNGDGPGTNTMSAWCGNCHGNFHNNNTQLIHPSGSTMKASVAGTYNLYNGTMDQLGAPAAPYLAAVPFEDPSVTTSSTTGPSASSLVSCVSCHRAHATSAPDAGRWDFSVTLLVEDGVESGSYAIPNPYPSDNQRSLCNKCHNKDAYDHNPF